MRKPLPHWVTEAMLRLEQNGEEAWLVGGCVRDSLLGRTPEDWDITTSARPEEIKKLFKDIKALFLYKVSSRPHLPGDGPPAGGGRA